MDQSTNRGGTKHYKPKWMDGYEANKKIERIHTCEQQYNCDIQSLGNLRIN